MFRLREGVRLHDGRRLAPEDVVASLEHARSDSESRRRSQLADVEGVSAPGPRTVVVRTRRPLDTLALRLSNVFIWARGARPGLPPVGTGPYRIRSLVPGGGATLEPFPEHWKAPPIVRGVTFQVVPEASDRRRWLSEGRAQIAAELQASAPSAEAGPAAPRTVLRADGLRVVFLAFDVARERSPYVSASPNPFRDRRVRQAVALAIDRRALLDGPLAGRAALADQMAAPKELGAYRDSLQSRPFDRAGARRMLGAAGHAGGFEVTLDHADDPDSRSVAAAIVSDLEKVGVRARSRVQSEALLTRRLDARDTSLCLGSWASDTGDGRVSYEYLLHTRGQGFGLANAGGYSDPALDSLIREATAPHDVDARRVLMARLAAKVALDVPIVPLYTIADVYSVVPGLEFAPRLDRQIRAAELRWAAP